MKKLLFLLTCFIFSSTVFAMTPDTLVNISEISTNPIDKETCTCKGIPLYGTVRITESVWADFTIEIVDSWPDIEVKKVTSFPSACGEWQFTESAFADFTVRIVSSGADFKVKFVDIWPGVK